MTVSIHRLLILHIIVRVFTRTAGETFAISKSLIMSRDSSALLIQTRGHFDNLTSPYLGHAFLTDQVN